MSERTAGDRHRVLVNLGSNIDKEANLPAAARLIAGRFRLLAASTIYETGAVGRPLQPTFFNATVLVETALDPPALKDALGGIERQLGRSRTADRFAPRTIDLDITLFDDLVIERDGLRIPDPDLLRYAHVAVPAAEIEPRRRHPLSGETLAEIAARTRASGTIEGIFRPRPDIDLVARPG